MKEKIKKLKDNEMKNSFIITIIGLSLSLCLQAQVAIGKPAVEGTDTLLDFGDDNNKGIVLPWVSSLDSNSPGTLYYNTAEGKVMCTGVNETIDLSVKGLQTPFDDTTRGYNTYTENPNMINGSVIGATQSSKKGVLVIQPAATDPRKAIILPKVTTYDNVGNPEPGTIVYDETKNMVCVFDGEQWAFWGKN